jgi:hypothetical protein
MEPSASNITMGIGVAVLAYGSLGFLMSAGATSLDPAPTGIGIVILLVGVVWSRLAK